MAHTTHPTFSAAAMAETTFDFLAGFGRAVLRAMSTAQNASSIAREVETLNGLSDEALSAQGKTRAGEVDRIFMRYANV